VAILGISPDSEASHKKFKAKNDLPFTLLVDEGHHVAEAYGVWVEKKNYGKTYMGIERSTFLIDADGRIEKAMRGVRAGGHAADVLELV
jgi:peroxiredoxin Q/BCP